MIKVTVTGLSGALKTSDDLAQALEKVGRAMMGEVGAFMVMQTKRNFQKMQSPEGEGWTPIGEQTAKRKGHQRILFETGALNRAIQVITLDEKGVSVGLSGFDAQKGAWHQFGTKRMAARPFLGFSLVREDAKRIQEIIKRHLTKYANEVGNGA